MLREEEEEEGGQGGSRGGGQEGALEGCVCLSLDIIRLELV